MNFPSRFRYRSDMDLFRRAVQTAEELIRRNMLFLLFGFESDISLMEEYSEEEFAACDFPVEKQEFDRVLHHEILHLLNTKLMTETPGSEVVQLKAFLRKNKVSPEDIEKISALYLEKLSYVSEHLATPENMRRSDFKFFTSGKKVEEFDWDICKYVFADRQEQPYVQIKISVADDLPGIQESPDVKPDSVQFVCDRQDVDYLIEQLTLIRGRLEEEYDG